MASEKYSDCGQTVSVLNSLTNSSSTGLRGHLQRK